MLEARTVFENIFFVSGADYNIKIVNLNCLLVVKVTEVDKMWLEILNFPDFSLVNMIDVVIKPPGIAE